MLGPSNVNLYFPGKIICLNFETLRCYVLLIIKKCVNGNWIFSAWLEMYTMATQIRIYIKKGADPKY